MMNYTFLYFINKTYFISIDKDQANIKGPLCN